MAAGEMLVQQIDVLDVNVSLISLADRRPMRQATLSLHGHSSGRLRLYSTVLTTPLVPSTDSSIELALVLVPCL